MVHLQKPTEAERKTFVPSLFRFGFHFPDLSQLRVLLMLFYLFLSHSEPFSPFTSSVQLSGASSDLCMQPCASLRAPYHYHLILMCSLSAGVPRAGKFV